MSGHSKWSTIKRQKGVKDAKRGAIFTKMGMAIAIATREGGSSDPASNFKLRLAVDAARAANMPNVNIQRAIDRGLGRGAEEALETVTYEGYGPAKVALIIIAATDNKNRTLPEVRGTLEKNGGTFATPGAVSWCFVDVGLVTVLKEDKSLDDIFEVAVDVGAEDVEDAGEMVEVYTKPQDVEKVKNALIDRGLTPKTVELIKKPATPVEITDAATAKKVLGLIEKLEELDDVQRVYSNFDISDKVLKEIQGY